MKLAAWIVIIALPLLSMCAATQMTEAADGLDLLLDESLAIIEESGMLDEDPRVVMSVSNAAHLGPLRAALAEMVDAGYVDVAGPPDANIRIVAFEEIEDLRAGLIETGHSQSEIGAILTTVKLYRPECLYQRPGAREALRRPSLTIVAGTKAVDVAEASSCIAAGIRRGIGLPARPVTDAATEIHFLDILSRCRRSASVDAAKLCVRGSGVAQ